VDNRYQIVDFEKSINLNYQEKYLEKTDFQTGDWKLAGSLEYMDPKLYRIAVNLK
jgi:hypothetical protein